MAEYPTLVRHKISGRILSCTPELAKRIGEDLEPYDEDQKFDQLIENTLDLVDLHWREIKRRVEAHGFEFTTKADGIELLTKLANGDQR